MSKDLDKALKDYEPVFDRPTPVRYNVLHFSDTHRRMDALLRRHYDSFHPLVRDIFTSFTLEFSLLLEKVENMEVEMKTFQDELDNKRRELDDELDERIQQLRQENSSLQKQMETKDDKISDLEQEVKQLNRILKEKEALIVTQRRQLDLYIDKETRLTREHQEQQKTLYASIEHVNEFTSELEKIEVDMRNLEHQRIQLEQENELLKHKLSETEDQYVTEVEDINSLYKELKNEFSSLFEKYQNIQYEKQDLESSLRKALDTKDMDRLKKQNMELQNQVLELEHQVNRQMNINNDMESKISRFKDMATKIMDMKEKLEQRDVEADEVSIEYEQIEPESKSPPVVVHPSDTVKKTRKWEKQKTPLEMEIEDNTNVDNSEPYEIEEQYKIVDKDVNLDASISRINSKFRELDSGISIISAMRPEHGHEAVVEDFTNRLMEELKDYDVIKEEPVEISKTKNLHKVFERLESKENAFVEAFAGDFPQPPDHEEKSVKTKHDNEKTKKKRTLNS